MSQDQVIKKSVAEVFGIDPAAFPKAVTKVFPATARTPKSLPMFKFKVESLRRLIVWAASVSMPPGYFGSDMKKNLMVYGPTGCGKTEMVKEFCARTGRSLVRQQCSEDTEVSTLFGSWKLCRPIFKDEPAEDAGIIEKGIAGIARAIEKLAISIKKSTGVGPEMTFVDGPVLEWARTPNSVLMLDEFDQLLPTVAMSLNAVLDGAEIYVPETGERIMPREGCLVAATGNTNGRGSAGGNGGSASLYKGVKRQNIATLDRFFAINATYLDEEEEKDLLIKQCRVPEAGATAMASLAAAIRKRFLGLNQDAGSEGAPLEFTITTRNVLNWGMSYIVFAATGLSSKEAFLESLRMTVLDFGTAEERAAVEDTWATLVGNV